MEPNLLFKRNLSEGMRDCLPLMAGGVPVGLACGMLSAAAGLNIWEIAFMSLTVFSGAGQLVAVSLLAAESFQPGQLLFNVMLVNIHTLLLAASLLPYILPLPRWLRWMLSFSLTDGTYAITMNRIDTKGYSPYYQLGASFIQYIFWISSNLAGAAMGNLITNPLAFGLDFTLIAVFIAILIPKLKNRLNLLVCISAAVTALLGAKYLPGKWYILFSCVTAAAAGIWFEGRINHAD